jgi:hypothetical protein
MMTISMTDRRHFTREAYFVKTWDEAFGDNRIKDETPYVARKRGVIGPKSPTENSIPETSHQVIGVAQAAAGRKPYTDPSCPNLERYDVIHDFLDQESWSRIPSAQTDAVARFCRGIGPNDMESSISKSRQTTASRLDDRCDGGPMRTHKVDCLSPFDLLVLHREKVNCSTSFLCQCYILTS